jgi:VanZ family protein
MLLQRASLWFALFWTLAIATSCLLPASVFKPVSFNLFQLDKLLHFVLYFVLVFSWLLTYQTRSKLSTSKSSIIILLSIGYGILIEILQAVSHTGRSYELDDIIANTIGVIGGWILFRPLLKWASPYKKYLPFLR